MWDITDGKLINHYDRNQGPAFLTTFTNQNTNGDIKKIDLIIPVYSLAQAAQSYITRKEEQAHFAMGDFDHTMGKFFISAYVDKYTSDGTKLSCGRTKKKNGYWNHFPGKTKPITIKNKHISEVLYDDIYMTIWFKNKQAQQKFSEKSVVLNKNSYFCRECAWEKDKYRDEESIYTECNSAAVLLKELEQHKFLDNFSHLRLKTLVERLNRVCYWDKETDDDMALTYGIQKLKGHYKDIGVQWDNNIPTVTEENGITTAMLTNTKERALIKSVSLSKEGDKYSLLVTTDAHNMYALHTLSSFSHSMHKDAKQLLYALCGAANTVYTSETLNQDLKLGSDKYNYNELKVMLNVVARHGLMPRDTIVNLERALNTVANNYNANNRPPPSYEESLAHNATPICTQFNNMRLSENVENASAQSTPKP